MGNQFDALADIVGRSFVSTGKQINPDDTHDEALSTAGTTPVAVVRPANTAEVAAIVAWAVEHRTALTARGSGTGLAGGCDPVDGGVVVSFERMNRIVEIDTANHVAVVEPGVTLAELDAALLPHGLVYPVFPGEQSASLGGNVATNAGGMRAVKYGVTRHHVLGLEAVLGSGDVIRTGGRFVKATSGYDLTQLIVGSEGTLALVTEALLRLHPRPPFAATVLAPFATVRQIGDAVPHLIRSGIAPLLVEYIDLVSMAGITANAGIELGIPDRLREQAHAYLVVVVEGHHQARLDEDVAALGELLADRDALDVFVLPHSAGSQLIEAREKAFWAAKAAGADDIVDVVVPRASLPEYLDTVGGLAAATGSLVVGCGHAGDGNVHLSVWQGDPEVRHRLLSDIVGAGLELGGAVSGEHGIGTEKKAFFERFEDPVKVEVMRRIKAVFDPVGILNPGTVFD
jgi:glycolate oxidase